MTILLAADIGGTKSELALFNEESGALVNIGHKRYLNVQHGGLDDILIDFLGAIPKQPMVACLAMAGVVDSDRVQLTNLPWIIERQSLMSRFSLQEVLFINDLTAVAASIFHLEPKDLVEIQAGERHANEVHGIIAPGTGLGEGMALTVADHTFYRGSEGGHCNFAPTDEEQQALLVFAKKEHTPVSYESLVAGPGLARLYRFCLQYYELAANESVAAAIDQGHDPVPVIIECALQDLPCPLCRLALELFLAILGSETGNLALKLYARGGMYLGGGILPRLLGRISFARFLAEFRNKGQMAPLMRTIPIHLILRRDAALLGAAQIGRREFLTGRADG